MKIKLLIVILFVTHAGVAQNLFTKAVAKIAKAAGKSTNVETSADLNTVTPLVIIESNLHSDKVGTISQTFFDGWIPGGDMSFVMFTAKRGYGFVKVDGQVTVDGKPVEYLTAGMYTQTTTANKNPRRVEIVTSSGQKSGFTIEPFQNTPYRIRSINGASDNISIDPTKDVVIEFDNLTVPAGGLLRVALAINQVSIKSLYDVAFIKAGNTITIPAAAFRNVNIKPAGNAVYNYKKSFLAVYYEEIKPAANVTGDLGSIDYIQSYSDGKFVTITAEPSLNPGLTVKGTEGNFAYDAFKANAFLSRPFSHAKTAGLLSFSIRGTTYKEVTQTSSTTPVRMNPFGGASAQTTVATITVSKELPWEAVLEEMYPEFMSVIQSELGANVIPVEKVTAAPSYKIIEMSAYDDPSTQVEFARTFRSTKAISAFMPISEGFGNNSVFQKIMNETSSDALVTLTLDLQLSQEADGSRMLMIPKLAFEIAGKGNGRIANTKFIAGTIEASTPSSFSKDVTAAELSALIRKTELIAAFRKALQQMKEQEKANSDYQTVWNLQR